MIKTIKVIFKKILNPFLISFLFFLNIFLILFCNSEDYGHFAEIAVDRNTHVGCGIIRFTRPDVPYVYIYNMVCNYASIYALDTPVYTVGQPGSRCLRGKNPYYPGLCSVNEPINPNYWVPVILCSSSSVVSLT